MSGGLIALGVVTCGVLLAVGKKLGDAALRFLGEAIADKLVDSLSTHLQPQWMADIDDLLEEALQPIRSELTANSGSSMKDHVTQITVQVGELQKAVETHITGRPPSPDDITGTPV